MSQMGELLILGQIKTPPCASLGFPRLDIEAGGGFSSDLPKGFEYIHTNILNFVTFHYKTHTFLN